MFAVAMYIPLVVGCHFYQLDQQDATDPNTIGGWGDQKFPLCVGHGKNNFIRRQQQIDLTKKKSSVEPFVSVAKLLSSRKANGSASAHSHILVANASNARTKMRRIVQFS